MPYLLDTSTCIDAMRQRANVVNRMAATQPGECVVSTVTSYELYTGIARCRDKDRERAKVDLFCKPFWNYPSIRRPREWPAGFGGYWNREVR